MQKANVTVRLNGSLTNTVPKLDVTPAEIQILRALHGGDDAVVDIRPTTFDKKVRPEAEVDRLRAKYDRSSSFVAKPGDENKSIIDLLYPGINKRLPTTLEEIGVDTGQVVPTTEPLPDLAPVGEDEQEADEAETEDSETAAGDSGDGQASTEAE